MATGDRRWLAQLESFSIQSLIRLILAMLGLLFLVTLASLLPGIEYLENEIPVSVTAIIHTMVTIALVAMLYRVASQTEPLIRQFSGDDEEFSSRIAHLVYWAVVLVAVGIAYLGFQPIGEYVFESVGFIPFYPILFGLIALIPLIFLSIEIGLLARHRSGFESAASGIDPEELRTDEQHIYQFLRQQGGTAYQGEVAEATGWSKAKVSRVLSKMEADDSIVRFRVGRQKIVCFPGKEPDYMSNLEQS